MVTVVAGIALPAAGPLIPASAFARISSSDLFLIRFMAADLTGVRAIDGHLFGQQLDGKD